MTSTRIHQLLISVVTLVMTASLTGCGGAQTRYASYLKRGKEYLAAHSWDKASIEFRNAIQIQPKQPEALELEGEVAQRLGNPRDAARFYQAAIDASPGYEPARASLGKLLIFSGAPQRALDVVAPALVAHPDNPDLLAVRAAARHELKDDTAAREDAERALQLAPTNENAVAILAALYAQARDYPRAISLVTGAVNQKPNSTDLREVLTNLYLVSGQSDQAEEQMRKIIALEPDELSPRAQLARRLTRAGKLDAAQSLLEETSSTFSTLKEQSKANEAKLMLVDFVAAQRSREQGEKMLRAFISQEPDNYDLRFGLADLLQRTGALQEAIAVYQEVITRDGLGAKGLIARDRIAAIQLDQGQDDRVRKLVGEVLQKNPRDGDALVLRATLEMRSNDPTNAIGDLRAVLRDRPSSIPLQRMLARAYMGKGDTALAEETLRAAMQSVPNDLTVRIDLADVLRQTNRAAQAQTLLEEGVAKAPDDIPMREALVKAYMAKPDLPAARTAAEELKKRHPESAVGFYLAARVKLAQNDTNGAISEYERVVTLAPAESGPVIELANLYEKQGRPDDAIARYQKLYETNTRVRQLTANNLAMLLVTYKTDRASLDRARDLTSDFTSSDNGSLLDTMGWVRFKRGEYQDALAVLERAVSRAPDSKVIRYHLAMTELRLGLRDQARSNLESALAGSANFTGSEEARSALASLGRRSS